MEEKVKTRMTLQRRVILEELRKVCSHPTADEIYAMVRKRLPRVSLGTIYRNLDVLAEQGEILRLESAGSQMRFDGNAMPHLHIRCMHCGRVGDVLGPPLEVHLSDYQAQGFVLSGAQLEFEGICQHCHGRN